MIVVLIGLAVLTTTGCGNDDQAASAHTLGPDASAAALRGEALVRNSGCVACHGADGSGGVGPGWNDLAGSQVALSDGRTVVADTEYLRRAITDPEAETVLGYNVSMPENQLSAEEVDDVIAYIEARS